MEPERTPEAAELLDRALRQVGTHALMLLDRRGAIVGWFAGAERLFGYTAEEVVGRNVSILFTPEDLARNLSEWEMRTAAGASDAEDDRWQVRKDGGRVWVSGTLTALRDDAGRVIGFAKITRNRTDQKSQVETLEGRIAALRAAAGRKDRLIATLAHELRTPLAAIAGAAQLLSPPGGGRGGAGGAAESGGGGRPGVEEMAVGVVRRQVEAMSRLIDGLLEGARAAVGKVQLRRERVVLQEVLAAAIEACRPAIDARTQELRVLGTDVPIRLQADPGRLRQVFVNLIDNARKYTPPGGTIWVTLTAEGEDAVVRVKDTGAGIAADAMPHIFDLFAQAETANAPAEGLGVGLSLARDLVALHDGSVQATSDGVGKGAEFTVRLPLKEEMMNDE